MNSWKSEKMMKDAKYSISWELNCIAGLTLYEEVAKGVWGVAKRDRV